MAEAVAAFRIGDSGGQHGSAHRFQYQGGIQVVTALLPGLGITPVVLREHPLPAPFPGGIRVLPRQGQGQGLGQLHPAPACRLIARWICRTCLSWCWIQSLLEVCPSRSRLADAPTVLCAGTALEHWLPSPPPTLLPLAS
jgi:hypothetical protein